MVADKLNNGSSENPQNKRSAAFILHDLDLVSALGHRDPELNVGLWSNHHDLLRDVQC